MVEFKLIKFVVFDVEFNDMVERLVAIDAFPAKGTLKMIVWKATNSLFVNAIPMTGFTSEVRFYPIDTEIGEVCNTSLIGSVNNNYQGEVVL